VTRKDPVTPLLRRFTNLAALGARSLRHVERTGRFLAELREFEGRDEDVFISSYPRSGTTWTQLIAHLVLRGGELEFRHINAVVPWFERSLALGRITARDLGALASPRVFKSHLPPHFLPARGRYLYVCREGLDVAVSYFSFYCSHLGYQGTFEEFFARFLSGHLQYRSWFGHVASWRDRASDPRVLWLDYQQMRRDPSSTVRALADFLGVSLSEPRVARICELASFDSMRRHESLFDHAADERFHSDVRAGQFVRRGEVGHGARQLTAAQRLTFETHLRGERPPSAGYCDLPAFLH